MNIRRLLVLAGVSLTSLSFSDAAFAAGQDTPVADKPAVEADEAELIVTARRRDEGSQDVPIVINAVTADTIEKLNIRSFQEITSVVPGLSLVANANGIGSSSSLRGVNHDVNASGENGTIQYYLNDSPVQSNLILQAMYDIGQIEVLRGPQGTLRGRATPSGSITIATRKPDLQDFGGYLSGTMGTGDTLNINGAVNVPIIRDVLAVRLAGLQDYNHGDRVRSVNSPLGPRRETESFRATVRAEPADFLRLGFTYQKLDAKSRGFDQVQSFALLDPTFAFSAGAPNYGTITPEDRLATQVNPRTTHSKFDFFNWNADVSFAGQRLIYVGAHQDITFHAITPGDQNNFFPANPIRQDVTTHTQNWVHEVRLQSDERAFGMLDYVVGYFRSSGGGRGTVLTQGSIGRAFGQLAPNVTFPLPAPPFTIVTPIYRPGGSGKEEAFFGNLTGYIGDRTELSGGLRHIRQTSSGPGLYLNCTPATFATCVAQPGTVNPENNKHTVYNLTARHRFSDNLMVYASTGTSWRPPVQAIGDFTNAAYTVNERAHIFLDAETSKSYEIGFKSNWLDQRLTFNATAYHQEFKNYPFRAGTGIYFININSGGAPERGQFNFVSAVPVKVNGVEAELAFRPTSRLSLDATLNWSKSKIGNATIACTDALNNGTGAIGSDGIPDVVVPTLAQMQQAYGAERLAVCAGGGQSATFQPEWSGSVRAEYDQPLTDNVHGYLRGLVAWKGKSATDPNNRFDDVDAYGLLNLYAGVRDPKGAWEVSLYAKNLTNVTEITSRADSPFPTSTVDIFLPPPFQGVAPVRTGSTSFNGRYSSVTVTPPREFGVTVRVAIGSR